MAIFYLKLWVVKVDQLDVCGSPLFGNLVTIETHSWYLFWNYTCMDVYCNIVTMQMIFVIMYKERFLWMRCKRGPCFVVQKTTWPFAIIQVLVQLTAHRIWPVFNWIRLNSLCLYINSGKYKAGVENNHNRIN